MDLDLLSLQGKSDHDLLLLSLQQQGVQGQAIERIEQHAIDTNGKIADALLDIERLKITKADKVDGQGRSYLILGAKILGIGVGIGMCILGVKEALALL